MLVRNSIFYFTKCIFVFIILVVQTDEMLCYVTYLSLQWCNPGEKRFTLAPSFKGIDQSQWNGKEEKITHIMTSGRKKENISILPDFPLNSSQASWQIKVEAILSESAPVS